MHLLLMMLALIATMLGAARAWTDAQRKEFVDAHNDFRRKANPPAAVMNRVIWSTRIEKIAVETTKSLGCVKLQHTDRAAREKNGVYGENAYMSIGMAQSPKAIVKLWYDEVADYTYSTQTCVTGKQCGHYTQVMRGKVSEIGCAECTEDTKRIVWCQYDYGNMMGEPIYEQGEQCSKCSMAKIKCDGAVCGKSPVVHCVDGLCDVKGDRPAIIGGTGGSAAVTPIKALTLLAVTVTLTLLGPLYSLIH